MALNTIMTKGPSDNRKTGPVYATYRRVGPTCPSGCPWMNHGCYAQQGHVSMQANRAGTLGENSMIEWMGRLPKDTMVRHMVSGDLMLNDEPDETFIDEMLAAHQGREDVRGWGYTHGWRQMKADRLNALPNLSFSASCDNLEDVEVALEAGWPAIVVAPEDWPHRVLEQETHTLVTCPQQTKGIQCIDCKLCLNPNRKSRGRPMVIVFKAHGPNNTIAKMNRRVEETWDNAAD